MRPILLLISTLSLLLPFTSAVRVVFRYGDDHPFPAMASSTAQTCNNLRPGRCCQGRSFDAIPGFFVDPAVRFPNYRVAQITGLQAMDIAAVWQPQGTTGGCSGTPRDTRPGPGEYRYPAEGSSDVVLTGASYIKLPNHRQPEGQTVPIMEAQGILGLITGGGKYVSKSAGSSLLQRMMSAQSGLQGSAGLGMRRRGIRSPDKGVVFAQPPPSAIWPDVVFFNGTEWVQEHEGSSIYTNKAGQVLDFQGK